MSLAALYARGPVFSLEVFPPKREGDVDALYRVFDELAPLRPDYISVTYGAGGSNVGLHFEITKRLMQLGITPLPHFTCVGQSRDQIREQLDRLAAAGVKNILALRGDPPKGETGFKPHPQGFAYASELVAFIRSRYDFCVGAAYYPEKHPDAPDAASDLAALKIKVDAGADFLNSQMFFDNAAYFAFVAKARAAGIKVPLVPAVYPVISARFFNREWGISFPAGFREGFSGTDAAADHEHGLAFASEQCRALLRAGVPGLHLYIMNRADTAARLWKDLGLAGAARA
ncbi:MAG TPA: methylenetetrahydrofolate reductase [bacterium]|jgi:methylenetetrahydrofolate reductase (NADPH)|nr:methylenetetrahydrofolate reductase [bacterium]